MSGVITDNDGLPIPGVSVVIKGTTIGTQTDFDGIYSINCNPGDILVFSYVGMTKQEVKITPEMLNSIEDLNFEYNYVKLKTTNDYKSAIETLSREKDSIISFDDEQKKVNKKLNSVNYKKIKDIDIVAHKVRLKLFAPEIYFEAGFNSRIGIQFVRDRNTPELQKLYSQGLSVNGIIEFQGPETNTIFSYGPEMNQLEYDGSNYVYDINGKLVNTGNGNGNQAIAYENNILKTVITNSNHAYFNASSDIESIKLDLQNANIKDIFNRELNTDNKISLKYERPSHLKNKHSWYALFSYQEQINNQPNINGFINQLLLNAWATPPSFSNDQSSVLEYNSHRRFSNAFNNPEWLLDNNRNALENRSLSASAIHTYEFSRDILFKSSLNYKHDENLQEFGVFKGTAGFEDGFFSNKKIIENSINAAINFQFEKEINQYDDLKLNSKIDYSYSDMAFSLDINENLNHLSFDGPLNTFNRSESKNRSILRLNQRASIDFSEGYGFKFVNNSYYSSIQNNRWFLPALEGYIDVERVLDLYSPFREILFKATYSQNINDVPLYYDNLSHNSLILNSEASLGYTSNNDLFISSDIDLEDIDTFELSLDFGIDLISYNDRFSFNYYQINNKGSVFPIFELGDFRLDNTADIRTLGFEAEYMTNIWLGNDLSYMPKISFSTYKSQVTDLYGNNDRLAIAGFSDVSKNLIENRPTGSIVGSAYLRDDQNNIVIGSDGFPLVDPQLQIIGNPIPDFNIGFTQKLNWKNFNIEIIMDIQKGGDVWNGTQNVLNYLGTSQQSATERNITNFVFEGVNQQGIANNTPVNFYDPNIPFEQNRFVRYGFGGVAEDAIEDGSYINIRSVNLSYNIRNNYNDEGKLVKEIKVSIYANNLFTWSKFRGRSPYSTFFGNRSANALNYFNMPLLSEVGFSLNLKI
jgi:hypothetical protein